MLNDTSMNTLAIAAVRSVDETESRFEIERWRSNGFSDCEIFRLATSQGTFAIRSWPNRFDSPSKVAFWSHVNLRFDAHEGSLENLGASRSRPFPDLYRWRTIEGSTTDLLPYENQLWTLSDWVVGESMSTRDVDRDLVQHLAMVLGRIHAQTRRTSDCNGEPLGQHRMRSHSLDDRLKSLAMVDHGLFNSIDRNPFFLVQDLSERLKHCIATVLERLVDWRRFLSICSAQERECHWIVRDLWRENILLDRHKRFAAIVDLGAARLDWPAWDFIRLFGSVSYRASSNVLVLDGDQRDLWKDAFAAYSREHREHAIESLDECKMLHHVSSGLSIWQWVRWVIDGTLDLSVASKANRVASRVAELCDRFLIESTL